MKGEYKNSDNGALFNNDNKSSQKAPDLKGKVTLSDELLQFLVAKRAQREDAVIDVAGWHKRSNAGQNYISVVVSKPYVKPQEGYAQPQSGYQSPQSGYQSPNAPYPPQQPQYTAPQQSPYPAPQPSTSYPPQGNPPQRQDGDPGFGNPGSGPEPWDK